MKNFEKPSCEIVRFGGGVLATSGCGCYDEIMDEVYPKNCTGDIGYCACKVNHNPAQDNCTPCSTNQGA